MTLIEEIPIANPVRTGRWTYVATARRGGHSGTATPAADGYPFPNVLANQAVPGGSSPSTAFPTPTSALTPGAGGPVPLARVRAAKRQIAGAAATGLLEEQMNSRAVLAASRRLAELEKENSRDVHIAIPAVKSDRKKEKFNQSTTPAVRKILQSQKTFANHLNDEEAMIMLQQNQSVYASHGHRSAQPAHHSSGTSSLLPLPQRETAASKPADGPDREAGDGSPGQTKKRKVTNKEIVERFPVPVPVPAPPPVRLIEAITSTPPLSHSAARARPAELSVGAAAEAGFGMAQVTAQRTFCEYCGYWGRVKCLACGIRTCSLGCKRVHDEFCLQRYI